MPAAIPVPPRLIDDLRHGDGRNARLFLENVKERIDAAHATITDLTNQISALRIQATGAGGSEKASASSLQSQINTNNTSITTINNQITTINGQIGLNFIQRKTASNSATLDFVLTPTYKDYLFIVEGLIPATNADRFWLRISQDSGVTFKAGATDYLWMELGANGAATGTAGSAGDSKVILNNDAISSTLTDGGISGDVYVYIPASTTQNKNIKSSLSSSTGGTGQQLSSNRGAYKTDQNATNAIRFLFSSGNISSGTIAMYGLL